MSSTPKPSFSATRRGRKRRGRAAGLVTLSAALVLALSGGAQARDLFKQDAFSTYKPDVANGEYMMNAAGCAACHAQGDDTRLLSGGLKMETFIGTFYVPNITAHANGIASWSNADFLNAVINGVGKDGRHLYPVMPYTAYAGMKPEDVLDMKAYIETLPASDNRVQAHELSFPYNLSATIAFWKRGNFDTAAYQPDDGSQLARGRYLVENAGGCIECHTPRTTSFGLDRTRLFEGEKGLTGAVAPSITKDRIASVSSEAFVKSVLTEGKKLSGAPFADPVMRKIADGLSKLTDDDKRAIYAYLTGREVEAPKVAETSKDACKETDALQASLVSTGSLDLGSQADDFVGKYCRNCHGPGESAQGSFPAGTLTSIATNAAFVTPGDRNRSLLYTSVASGRMPYGKQPSKAEVEQLGQWIDSLNEPQAIQIASAAPPARQRPVLPWRGFIQAAVTDVGQLPETDRTNIRYFSYRLQFNGKLPCEDEQAFARRQSLHEAGFHKLLNSVSLGNSLVVPDKVEGTRDLLVRVDIRDLGWDADKWDKLAKTYPFGYDPASDSVLKTLAAETGTDLPVMRVDWFMANASRPENYHMLLDLPENIADLEKKLGVDANDNIKRRRVIRAAFFEGSSGVSDHNRMIERHDASQGGYYWKSYDFAGSRDKQNLRERPHGPTDIAPLDESLEAFEHDGGEMIFSLPNGLQAYYLSTAKGDRLDRGPTSIVSFRQRPIGKGVDIINGRSCFTCHFDGTIAKRDQMRDYVANSPKFTNAQRDVLLATYVEQAELDRHFAQDRQRFVGALDKIGATEKAPDGTLTSRTAPGKEEIITWFADSYEEDLDAEALAAEFDMTPEQFEQSIQRVGDAQVLKIGLDWVTQLKGGSTIPRFEVEQQFAKLAKPLLGIDPLEPAAEESATTSEADTDDKKDDAKKDDAKADDKSDDKKDDATAKSDDAKADDKKEAKKDDPETPAYKDADKEGKLTLRVDVKNTDVFVDEKLSFDVIASKACELQIFYVEADGNVEVIPQEMIGEAFLESEKARRIPDPATGDLVFDEAASDETLLLFCREGGLGDQKLSADDAKALVKKSGEPASRGLAIELFEKKTAEEKKAPATKGTSAIHMVTFNVKDRS